jgi:hypothetical protein
MDKKKLLIITPHLSTGGAPQVTVNKISLIKDFYDIKVVEYSCLSWSFVVQKNRIIDLIGQENLITLGTDDENHENNLLLKMGLFNVIEDFNPDVISMEEFPELFMHSEVASKLYSKDRNYKIFESTHESSFNSNSKTFFPDKFIYISAYSGLKNVNFDIPFEVIEYPVDPKEKNTDEARKKLQLDPTYKHVVNIGLFTPRKNQKYVFELSHKLKEYKVQFHFLGNQADNFKFYWEPLLNLKNQYPDDYKNCIVWGERNDTDDFIQASDMFLFTSKGDKGNKELNPIVIKEALQYNIPMLMFNLDVYCGKYDEYENVNYLTGNIDQDTEKILKILNPEKIMEVQPIVAQSDEVIIIGTYPNTSERSKLTFDCINSLKKTGRKIILVSHYPVVPEIQCLVDFYIFDIYNPLTFHSFYNKFYNYNDTYDVEININGLHNTNQSLTVLTNLFNGFKAAKSYGFKKAIYMTYDVVLNELDIPKISEIFTNLRTYNAQLCYNKTPFGNGIETTCMGLDVDYFLNTFEDVRTPEEYEVSRNKFSCHNFLEDYMFNAMNKENVLFEDNDQHTLLTNSGLGVSSHSEYYSILPISDRNNEFMFYFFTYNIDDRKINLVILEGESEMCNETFNIRENREFKKELKFNGTPINVIMVFYDGENPYKVERYLISNETIANLNKTGFFKYKTSPSPKPVLEEGKSNNPKIKLVHLQTTRNDEREQISRKSLERLKDHGIEYVLHQNEPYVDLPPKGNCIRPDCVSLKLFNEEEVQKYGTALTPAHYGCFDSFKTGILTEFQEEDFLIVCEGDCILETSIEDFVKKVYEVCKIIPRTKIGYFSFGDTETLDFGWHQSNVVEEVPDQNLLFITDKIIGLQCIMFPKSAKQFLFNKLRTHKWDAADIYFNTIFYNSEFKMGILKERITSQADGLSLIDNEFKTFRKK